MTEPTTSAIATFAGWKALSGSTIGTTIGAAIFAGLAALVVMCMMTPRSPQEWAVGLVSTFIGSICGGAAVIQYFGLAAWLTSFVGTVGLLGVVFACGLPAWAVVRWFFSYVNARSKANIIDVIKEFNQTTRSHNGYGYERNYNDYGNQNQRRHEVEPPEDQQQ